MNKITKTDFSMMNGSIPSKHIHISSMNVIPSVVTTVAKNNVVIEKFTQNRKTQTSIWWSPSIESKTCCYRPIFVKLIEMKFLSTDDHCEGLVEGRRCI